MKRQPLYTPQCVCPATRVTPRSSAAPSMRCGGCSHTFCFTHGDSHPGKSCAQWARDNLESEKETEKVIKSLTKPCAGCAVATQKSAGCNHMKCTRCKTEWCWLCGSAIMVGGTYPSHYADWNVFGCRGAQFTDSQRDSSACTKVALVLLAPLLLVPAVAFLLIWCGRRAAVPPAPNAVKLSHAVHQAAFSPAVDGHVLRKAS